MRWLPGRRVGVIALANARYAPMRLLTRRLLELLDDRGLVPAAAVALSAPLQDAARRLVALLNDWDDIAAADLFADNVAPDESLPASGRDAARSLVDGHGPLRLIEVVASTATEGTATVPAADGFSASVEVLLSPHVPPQVQRYRIRPQPA